MSKTQMMLVTATLFLCFNCKPPAGSDTKAIVGRDADGLGHAFSLMTVQNFVSPNASGQEPTTEEGKYAHDLLDHQFFALIDCFDLPNRPAEVAIKDMELEAALGNVYVTDTRHLLRRSLSTGEVDEKLPCRIISPHIYPVNIVDQALDAAYIAKPTEVEFRISQAVYLALRGNTVPGSNDVSALMKSWVTTNSLFFGTGAISASDLNKIIAQKDKDLNPCIDATGAFGKLKFKYFSKSPIKGSNACNYTPTAASGNVGQARSFVGSLLDQIYKMSYPYNEASATPGEALWEALTSTKTWDQQTGRAGSIAAALSGKSNLDFSQTFTGTKYEFAGTGIGLGLTDDASADEPINGLALATKVAPRKGTGQAQRFPNANKSCTCTRSGSVATAADKSRAAAVPAARQAAINTQTNAALKAQFDQANALVKGAPTTPAALNAPNGFAAMARSTQAASQAANINDINKAIQAHQLVPTDKTIGGMAQYTGTVGGVPGSTVYVGPKGTQTWQPTKVPADVAAANRMPAGASVNFMKELGNPFVGGVDKGNGTAAQQSANIANDNNAGFAQIQTGTGASTQRAIAVGFSGDGNKGVNMIPATLNSEGQVVVDTKNPATADAVKNAYTAYQTAQNNQLSILNNPESVAASRLQATEDFNKNNRVYDQETAAGAVMGPRMELPTTPIATEVASQTNPVTASGPTPSTAVTGAPTDAPVTSPPVVPEEKPADALLPQNAEAPAQQNEETPGVVVPDNLPDTSGISLH